jgi:MFS family permease
MGDAIAYLTLPLFVLSLARSNFDFALTYSLENIPTLLFGFLGGVLLDRIGLRSVMIAADLARAGAFVALAFLARQTDPGLWGVFLLAFVIGSFSAAFQTALSAVLPALVPAKSLVVANGRLAAAQQAAFLAGPAIAGVLVAITNSASTGFLLNALTFLVSAASIVMVGPVAKAEIEERKGFIEDALNGIRYLWGELRLRATTIASAIVNFVTGFIESTFVVLATDILGTTSTRQIGIIFTSLGLGGIAGAAVAGRVSRWLGLGRTMILGLIVFSLSLWVAVNSLYGPKLLLVMFTFFAGASLINVPIFTIRQTYTPPAMLGRVIAASRAISWSTLPLGSLLGAALSDTAIGYRSVVLAAPAILIATAAALFFTPVWRDTFGPRTGKRIA